MTTAQKLDQARRRARAAREAADLAYGNVGAPDDPGALSGVRRSTTARQARRVEAGSDRALALVKAAWEAEDEVIRLRGRLLNEQTEVVANANATVNIDDLRPGDLIRHRHHGSSQWAVVRRVNAKTITCEPMWQGHDAPRIVKDRILETRHGEAP